MEVKGEISIVDLSDHQQLTIAIRSSMPKVQIFDPNNNEYIPDWNVSHVILTPILFLDNKPLDLTSPDLKIIWKRKEGTHEETNLTIGEIVTNKILTITTNSLSHTDSSILTYIAHVIYVDSETNQNIECQSDIDFTLLQQAMNTKLVSISGEQVFKYNSSNVLIGPSKIALNAHVQGVHIKKWQFKNESDEWMDYPTYSENSNIHSPVLIITPTHMVFFNNLALIRVVTTDETLYDMVSIVKLFDGAQGDDAYTVLLTNEAQLLPSLSTGECLAETFITNIIAYKGSTKILPILKHVSDLPRGMTLSPSNLNDEIQCTITVAEGAVLDNQDTGKITLTIQLDKMSFVKTLNWGKSKQGAEGESAILFSVFAPNGNFVQNNEGEVILEATAYEGSKMIQSAAFQWAKLVSGSYVNVPKATSSLLTVNGRDIQNIETYRCMMIYKNNSYIDTITVEDKSDLYSTYIHSTKGCVFKNTKEDTILQAFLYANGNEIDRVLSDSISETAPSSPIKGSYWYKVDKTFKTVVLQQYNGISWIAVAENYKFDYKWYRMNKTGETIDHDAPYRVGKLLYVSAADFDDNTIFNLEVHDER